MRFLFLLGKRTTLAGCLGKPPHSRQFPQAPRPRKEKTPMKAIEIARKMVQLGQTQDACRAYALVIHEGVQNAPAEQLEAAVYILQAGGDYKISYTAFLDLYRRGYYREDILSLMTQVFYAPNIKMLKSRYERNCKLLSKYVYLFRKDFLPFEELPIRFFPYDDQNGYLPFYAEKGEFGDFINFKETVISRNFFKDLENPILAGDVFSQYELEYLNDNVRRSEDIGRENHIYLHYSDWGMFCAYLQCLNLRRLLESKKIVFLIGEELEQYPIDFKERFGIDYSQCDVKPIGIREVTRLIWHTQLSTHNGGDFFNEVFDGHPNLIFLPSVMMSNITENIRKIKDALAESANLREATQRFEWPTQLIEELYHMKDRRDKDLMVALFMSNEAAMCCTQADSRIVPALFFQPHFANVVYRLRVNSANRTVLESEDYDAVRQFPAFRDFKYIKTFTPMRRFTTSHGATVKFMFQQAQLADDREAGKKKTVVSDAIMERILNRSFMIDPEDRLYKDGVVVRLEDGKLNSKATFTALAAFLDLPYTESMTFGSMGGEPVDHLREGNCAPGFGLAPVYRTYDEYINDDERYFIEYFLRDAYEYYGYGFHNYDGAPVDEAKAEQLISGFTTLNHYMEETWIKLFLDAEVSQDGKRVDAETERMVQRKLAQDYLKQFDENRINNVKILLEGLRFVNKSGQPLKMMPKLKLDEALLERPLYR